MKLDMQALDCDFYAFLGAQDVAGATASASCTGRRNGWKKMQPFKAAAT